MKRRGKNVFPIQPQLRAIYMVLFSFRSYPVEGYGGATTKGLAGQRLTLWDIAARGSAKAHPILVSS